MPCRAAGPRYNFAPLSGPLQSVPPQCSADSNGPVTKTLEANVSTVHWYALTLNKSEHTQLRKFMLIHIVISCPSSASGYQSRRSNHLQKCSRSVGICFTGVTFGATTRPFLVCCAGAITTQVPHLKLWSILGTLSMWKWWVYLLPEQTSLELSACCLGNFAMSTHLITCTLFQ